MPGTQLLLPLGAVVGTLAPSGPKRLSSGSVHPPPVSQLSLVLPQPRPGNTDQETEEQQHFQNIFRQIAGDVSTSNSNSHRHSSHDQFLHHHSVEVIWVETGYVWVAQTSTSQVLAFWTNTPMGWLRGLLAELPTAVLTARVQCPSSTEKPHFPTAIALTGTVQTGAAGIHFAKPLPSSSVLLNVTPLPSCSGHGDLCRRAQEYPELSCEQT